MERLAAACQDCLCKCVSARELDGLNWILIDWTEKK